MSLPSTLISAKALSLLLASMSLGLVSPQMGLANTASTPVAAGNTTTTNPTPTITLTTEAKAAVEAKVDATEAAKAKEEESRAMQTAITDTGKAIVANTAAHLAAKEAVVAVVDAAVADAANAANAALAAKVALAEAAEAEAEADVAAADAAADAVTEADLEEIKAIIALAAAALAAAQANADPEATAAAAEALAAAQAKAADAAAKAAKVKATAADAARAKTALTAAIAAAAQAEANSAAKAAAKAAASDASTKIKDAVAAAHTARLADEKAIKRRAMAEANPAAADAAVAAATATAEAAAARTAAAAKLTAAKAALAEAKLKAAEAGSEAKLTAALTAAEAKLKAAEATAEAQAAKTKAAEAAIAAAAQAQIAADAKAQIAKAANATLATANRESWKSTIFADKDKAYTFSYNSKVSVNEITQPNIKFEWQQVDGTYQPKLIKEFQREGVKDQHTISFSTNTTPVRDHLIINYDYREYADKYEDDDDVYEMRAFVKSNYRRDDDIDDDIIDVPNTDYLVYGSWLYLEKQSGYSEMGSIIQGPEFDHKKAHLIPEDTPSGHGAIPSRGKATYYRENGAGGIYRYDGKYRKFEADVKLTAYFGQPIIKYDDGTVFRPRQDQEQTHMEGCIGCNDSFSILDRNGSLVKNTTIELDKGIASSNSLRNVGTIRENISENDMSGQWQAKMSKIPTSNASVDPRSSVSRLTAGTFEAEWSGSEGNGNKAQITGYFVAPVTEFDIHHNQPSPQ